MLRAFERAANIRRSPECAVAGSFVRQRRKRSRIAHRRWPTVTPPSRVCSPTWPQCLRRCVPRERAAPGEQFIEHAAERPDVGALVDVAASRLFRTHVRRREPTMRPASAPGRPVTSDADEALDGASEGHAFAKPKSRTFTGPSGVTLMFAASGHGG